MLDCINNTPWSAVLARGWDSRGHPQTTVVVKSTFQFDESGELQPAPEQDPVIETDEFRGKPYWSSLAAASETVPFKHGAELYLYGTAQPLSGARAMKVAIGLTGPGERRWEKVLAVFGPRRWERRLGAYLPGEPEELVPTPIIYENALGGRHPDNEDLHDEHNPAGVGFNPPGLKLVAPSLPAIEVAPYMTDPRDRRPPAGFGPLPVLWEPRRSRLGEPEEDAPSLPDRCPWPAPLDPHAFHYAPGDQWFQEPFQGGEQLTLSGLVPGLPPGKQLTLVLPCPALEVAVRMRGRVAPHTMSLVMDTVVVDTDRMRLWVIQRGAVAGGLRDQARGVVVIDTMESGQQPLDESRLAS